jgi:hypothetical protein
MVYVQYEANMAWKIYELCYEAKSPLHLGFRETGNVVRTRYYIPASTMWGALTAQLTRALFANGAAAANYQQVGDYVEQHLRLGYFFPQFENGNCTRETCYPQLRPEGEFYGPLSRDEFERRFLASMASAALEVTTAVKGASNTKNKARQTFAQEDGQLHEIEMLVPNKAAGGKWAKLYFTGYAYFEQPRPSLHGPGADDLADDNFVLSILDEIFVGGERRYGFGRLKLINKTAVGSAPYPHPIAQDFRVDKTNPQEPFVHVATHVVWNASDQQRFSGAIEPYVKRLWANNEQGKSGAGQKFSRADVCWIPGSRMRVDDPTQFQSIVGPGGLWQMMHN